MRDTDERDRGQYMHLCRVGSSGASRGGAGAQSVYLYVQTPIRTYGLQGECGMGKPSKPASCVLLFFRKIVRLGQLVGGMEVAEVRSVNLLPVLYTCLGGPTTRVSEIFEF